MHPQHIKSLPLRISFAARLVGTYDFSLSKSSIVVGNNLCLESFLKSAHIAVLHIAVLELSLRQSESELGGMAELMHHLRSVIVRGAAH